MSETREMSEDELRELVWAQVGDQPWHVPEEWAFPEAWAIPDDAFEIVPADEPGGPSFNPTF